MNQSNISKGIALAVATAVISGFSIFYSKIAVIKIDPLILTASRNLFVGLLFFILVIGTKKYKEIAKLKRKDILSLLLIGFVGGSLPFYLFFTGLKLIGAQQANMIHKTLFIWVALLSFVFLKEKINVKLLIAGLLIFVGTYLFTPVRLAFGQGSQMLLIAVFLWSVETIIAKKVLAQVSSELVGLSRMLLGGGLLAVVMFVSGKGPAFFSLGITQLSMIAVGGMLLFFYVYTWYKALAYAPAGVVTLILTGSLIVGNILSGAVIHSRLLTADWLSMLCIAGGVTISVIGGVSRKQAAASKIQDKT